MSGYEMNEKDIATVIRYLKIHNPENTSQEYAIQMLELMHEIAKEMVEEDLEFAELFMEALNKRKRLDRQNKEGIEHTDRP